MTRSSKRKFLRLCYGHDSAPNAICGKLVSFAVIFFGVWLACLFMTGLASAQGLNGQPLENPDKNDPVPQAFQDNSGPLILIPDASRQSIRSNEAFPGGANFLFNSGVSVERLMPLEWDTIGLINVEEAGFEQTLWQGADSDAVIMSLESLPQSLYSQALRDLLNRLLVARNWPVTSDAMRESRGAGYSLALRSKALLDYGAWQGLAALLKIAPTRRAHPQMSEIRRNLSLMALDEKICADRVPPLSQDRAVLHNHLKFQMLCDLKANTLAQADLHYDLLREGKMDGDTDYFALVESLMGYRAPPKGAGFTPYTYFLASKLAEKGQSVQLTSGNPSWKALIALEEFVPLSQALPLAEQAVNAGSMESLDLAQLYSLVPASQDEIFQIMDNTPLPSTAEQRALTFQASLQTDFADIRERLWSNFLTSAKQAGVYMAAARTLLPHVQGLPQTAGTLPSALTVARLMAMNGHPVEAERWIAFFLQEGGDADALKTDALKTVHYPLLAYIILSLPTGPDAKRDHALMQQVPAFVTRSARKALISNLTLAFWEDDPAGFLAGLDGAGEDMQNIQSFIQSTTDMKQGLILLSAASFLGGSPLADIPAARLSAIAYVLRVNGFVTEAKAFAREALAAYGV